MTGLRWSGISFLGESDLACVPLLPLTMVSNALSVVGTFALVVYSFPYLGLAFIPLGIFYVSLCYLPHRISAPALSFYVQPLYK